MRRRTLLPLAGWLAAAMVATAVGVAAVRLIDTGSGRDPGGEVLTPQQVAEQLAALPATTPVAPSGEPSRESGARRPLSGPGGTVVATCVEGQAFLVSWTPAQGYGVERVERGPYEHADVRFEGSAGRSEVRVRCANGEPVAVWGD